MLLSLLLATASCLTPIRAADPLVDGFQNPPASAKPHTWWHWMNGNVTKEGITADLECMKRVGIGGAQMFTVPEGIPKGPVDYMSPKWREMTVWAVNEAGRLGIELCIHNCAGWSSSGGPWITPENAMQVIAWSEKKVQGPANFDETLPRAKAPQVYANVPYYKDIAVYAFPTPSEGDVSKTPQDRNLFLGKTGVIRYDGLEPDVYPLPAGIAIQMSSVIDLSTKMDASGKLTWNVPEGNWTILRIGHVPTGKDNHPAPPEGDGLEVDKLSRAALDTHWNGMMAKVLSDIGPLAGKVLNNSLIDSYEVGSQNWTSNMRDEFIKRRGYDPMPFLPVIAGYTLDTNAISERFLWDWRRTIADLFKDNYYDYFGQLCHRAGLLFSTEPYGNGGFDNIQAGGTSDIPMGEFWIGGGAIETTKVAASVGHVYGRKYIGAESFTADEGRGKFLEEPYGIKALGDQIFCNGINRYIFHRYAMQPWMDLNPGMTMGPWGSHFERTETWWQGENSPAAAWLKYVARCQFMLQQGQFVADVVYCTGEGAPADLPYRPNLKPTMPNGYDYDGCDAEILMKARVENGRIVFPSGMSYRILVLPDTFFMTPAFATKIKQLVTAGATVVAPKPDMSPSLSGFPKCDEEVAKIANEVWAGVDGKTITQRALGKGKVVWGSKLEDVLKGASTPKDFEAKGVLSASRLMYIHRRTGGTDAYFVSNQKYQYSQAECTFRISGKLPELWHADTGVIEPAPVYREEKGRTVVPLTFGPAESVFVVFRKQMPKKHLVRFDVGGAIGEKPAPKITILSAHYGTDDGRGADVTKTVADLVAQGEMEIAASNGLFGDPVVNVVKRLKIVYEIGDNKGAITQSVPENSTAVLVPNPGTGSEPPVKIAADFEGNLTIIANKNATCNGVWSNGRGETWLLTGGAKSQRVIGPWRLTFPKNLGAPANAEFSKLISWTELPVDGIKYFSGAATYTNDLFVPASLFGPSSSGRIQIAKPRRTILDLGTVKNFAKVRLNGKELAVLWKEPFHVDVTGVLIIGNNKLEIEVTNLWPNRLIGDEQLEPDVEWEGMRLKKWPDWLINGQSRPNTGRIAFTTWHFWRKDSLLLESGLIGPVMLRSAPIVRISQ